MITRICTISFAALLIGSMSAPASIADPLPQTDTVYNGGHPGQSGPNGPGNGNGGNNGGGDGSGNGNPGRSGPGNS